MSTKSAWKGQPVQVYRRKINTGKGAWNLWRSNFADELVCEAERCSQQGFKSHHKKDTDHSIRTFTKLMLWTSFFSLNCCNCCSSLIVSNNLSHSRVHKFYIYNRNLWTSIVLKMNKHEVFFFWYHDTKWLYENEINNQEWHKATFDSFLMHGSIESIFMYICKMWNKTFYYQINFILHIIK